MELFAVFSDIHGNLEALLEAWEDARRLARTMGVQRPKVISLGDVVDYGPDPNETAQWVLDHAFIALSGNHEDFVVGKLGSIPLHDPDFWPIAFWTRRELGEDLKSQMRAWPENWSPGLRSDSPLREFTLCHNGIVQGGAGAIRTASDAARYLKAMKTPYTLFGHTHYQGFFQQNEKLENQADMYLVARNSHTSPVPEKVELGSSDSPRNCWWRVSPEQWFDLPDFSLRSLINPGSIGQPRSHQFIRAGHYRDGKKASYLLLKVSRDGPLELNFRRVPYDYQTTIAKLEAIRFPADTTEAEARNILDILNGNQRSLYYGEVTPRGPLPDAETQRNPVEVLNKRLNDLVKTKLIPMLIPVDEA